MWSLSSERDHMPRLPERRTITVVFYEPWLLGWARWAIETDLHYGNDRASLRTTLASGRWKWRGRRARFFEATVDADLYFQGAPT